MDGSGDQLFSSAGLPGDQHRSGTVGDPPDHPLDLGNGRAGADDPVSYTHLDVYKRQLLFRFFRYGPGLHHGHGTDDLYRSPLYPVRSDR